MPPRFDLPKILQTSLRHAVVSLALAVPTAALAQTDAPRIPSHCISLAHAAPEARILRAAWSDPVRADAVRISYVDHSMFLLQTPGGLNMMTDYTGFLGNAGLIPDVVTMNHAHSSHWTPAPDPAIPHVLQGWADAQGPARHSLDLGEVLVRNVPTDIRGRAGGAMVEEDGNSIFIFEVAGLCIGHLGHLHHVPDAAQLASIGRLDVVMAPVDGGMTLDLPSMIETLQRFRASVVIPMHWFSEGSLQRFTTGMEDQFDIVRAGMSDLTLSRDSLPGRPTVMVLEPAWLTGPTSAPVPD
ncbi:MAG: MBL fold metallo-hydrolase [Celeribacter sp.]|jgi:L-ascorbate metabolism protein UlaG (beta-lactamase superfamily)